MELHKVIDLRAISETAFIVRVKRQNIVFTPGLHISVGIRSDETRPYSIYSSINDPFLEILVKEVPIGSISSKLRKLSTGDEIYVGKPKGYFCLPQHYSGERICLIATGTGIAPFHSFVKSYPHLNYQLFHGVRNLSEAYDKEQYQKDKITICTSKSSEGDCSGRVTTAIEQIIVKNFSLFYICGSYEMIDDVYDILSDKGVKKDHIKTEGYY